MQSYKIESHVKPPKTRKQRKCPPNVREAYEAYADAYRLAYGFKPEGFTYDKETKLIKVDNSAGVSLKRLKELTRMLKYKGTQ